MPALSGTRLLLCRFVRATGGNFAMMTATVTPMALALAAFAVDAGSLYLEKRRAQSLADLAAITVAANLHDPVEAARLVFADNGVHHIALGTIGDDGKVRWQPGDEVASVAESAVLTRGRYLSALTIPPAERFTRAPGEGGDVNAVKVTYRKTGTRYFAASIIPPPQIVVEATAATDRKAAFSVGSRLLELKDGIANALLGGLTGSTVSLTVMDYEALLGARVSLLSFLDGLATELDLTAGSYDEVLDAEVSLGQVAKVLSKTPGIGGRAQTASQTLATQAGAPGSGTFPLSQLIGLSGSVARATIQQVGAEVDVMELLSMSAILAGQGRQVKLDLGAALPGLLAVSVDLAIGEPPQKSPWFAIGSSGEVVRTAQTRLRVVVDIGNNPLLTGLLGARIRLPLYLELAYAEAKLDAISCPTGRRDSIKVAIDARPGIANLYLAEVDPSKIVNFANPAPRSPAKLIQVTAVNVTGQAQAEIGAINYKRLNFTMSDIDGRKVRQVSTGTIATSLTESLFSSLSLEISVGLGFLNIPLITLPPNTTALLAGTIRAAAGPVDMLLGEVLKMLGLSLGQADIRVHGATCGRAVLVQ
ncbi:pilus assembly protein TadG-related protein [Aquamicrobium sp.]|uniref:pilus assembly protein TadG-related protein n=1 Tax=Aquamicrobium sp. TaxID=1872579 RepID=UPI00349EA94A